MKTADSKFEFRNANFGFSSEARTFAGIGFLGQYYDHYEMMGGGGWWWMWIVWVGGFILFVLLIFLLVAGFRNGGQRMPRPPHETPLDVLKRRYAAGEITREQYEQMRQDLEK